MNDLRSTSAGDGTVIVGGGLGGLAAACTLAARGHGVTLLDKNAWVGGKAAVLHQAGFRFDMGPTITAAGASASTCAGLEIPTSPGTATTMTRCRMT